MCMQNKRIVAPILYLPAFSKDRHRLIKWRMHWLPSYPLKDCRCGYKEAKREHFSSCPLLTTLLLDPINKYGTIPPLTYPMQPIDFIINNTPRSELGLSSEKWKLSGLHLLESYEKLIFLVTRMKFPMRTNQHQRKLWNYP